MELTDLQFERYARHLILDEVGEEGQAKLLGARVLVVGAGGLGQMLSYHLGLFQMRETSTVLLGMILLVAVVDGFSFLSRRWLNR